MPFKLTARDNGANAVLANAGVRLRVNVGVIGAKASAQHKSEDGENPLTIAEIAEKHELGLGVPERSFLRAYVDANVAEIRKDLRAAYKQILRGKLGVKQAATLIGAKHAAGVQQWIADNKVVPPSTEQTNRRKGSSTTLIDTGQLRAAITHMVTLALSRGSLGR